jgi:hypothetical protein
MYAKQFEGLFTLVEVVQASVTIASTAAGASSVVSGVTPASSQAALGDIVLVSVPGNTGGAVVDASVTAAGTLAVSTFNPTGASTYNPGAQLLTFVVLRLAPLFQ